MLITVTPPVPLSPKPVQAWRKSDGINWEPPLGASLGYSRNQVNMRSSSFLLGSGSAGLHLGREGTLGSRLCDSQRLPVILATATAAVIDFIFHHACV